MISQQNEISLPPFKKIKLPIVNMTPITSNNKETSSVTFTYNKKKNILKLKQFELFKILSFLTNERNSILKMLCLNKTIFNEIFNEKTLQENINKFILGNENVFVAIILSIIFNYNLNLFINNEIYYTLQKILQFPEVQNFYCNDGEEQFSSDTMIYREKDDDFLQFEYEHYLQQISNDNYKRMCHSSLQNENYLLFSNLKNTLNRLRNCFDFLTSHIQSLQSYFYKRKQWSTWLNELSNRYKDNDEKLQNIQYELKTKIFDKVNFVKSKKNDMLDFHIYIKKYNIGENLEFKYNAAGYKGNPFTQAIIFKVYNNNLQVDKNINEILTFIESNNETLMLIESNAYKIKIDPQKLEIIKTILQIDSNLASYELLIEAILMSCPQWNILHFIRKDFHITKISFDDITFTCFSDSDNDEEEEENNDDEEQNDEDGDMEDNDEELTTNKEDNKPIEKDVETFTIVEIQKNENKFTILHLPVELLNYICNYLFYFKDGLSFCLTSKDIYNAIYSNNTLFKPNKLLFTSSIPLIMTVIYNSFKEIFEEYNENTNFGILKNNLYFDLTFSGKSGKVDNYNNNFKLFTTSLQRIEHFIGYIDSLQRYIYVKHFELDNFLNGINDKYISQQLNDKIFKKLFYQFSQINVLNDHWQYKALFHINNCIYFEQLIRVINYNVPTIFWNIKFTGDSQYIDGCTLQDDLLKQIDEKQLRKYLYLEDERVTNDLIFKCLKCCSPFKFEFIDYCEKNIKFILI
ncbi:hypothetical protein ABK040_011333 [Willaertia magna]